MTQVSWIFSPPLCSVLSDWNQPQREWGAVANSSAQGATVCSRVWWNPSWPPAVSAVTYVPCACFLISHHVPELHYIQSHLRCPEDWQKAIRGSLWLSCIPGEGSLYFVFPSFLSFAPPQGVLVCAIDAHRAFVHALDYTWALFSWETNRQAISPAPAWSLLCCLLQITPLPSPSQPPAACLGNFIYSFGFFFLWLW